MDVLGRQLAKTILDVVSLRREHVWTCSDLGDNICEMKRLIV